MANKTTTAAPEQLEETAPETEARLRATMAGAFGSMFEIDDRVAIVTHSDRKFAGVVEDSNIVGLLVRLDDERLVFVSFTGIEHAEIFEEPDPGEGEHAEDAAELEEPAEESPPVTAGEEVTPITTRTRAA